MWAKAEGGMQKKGRRRNRKEHNCGSRERKDDGKFERESWRNSLQSFPWGYSQ